MECYKCKNTLTKQNNSKEHIINDFLGGQIWSRELLCNACNSEFGSTIDAELNKQIGIFSDIIGVVRTSKRKKDNIKIELETKTGKKTIVGENLIPKPRYYLQLSKTDEPKLIHYANDDEDLKKFAEKKDKEMAQKSGEKEMIYAPYSELPINEKYFIRNDPNLPIGQFGIGGELFFRAIGKIILNFFLSRRQHDSIPQHLIDFVCNGKITSYRNLFFYYPATYSIYKHDEKEFSHVLYLKGDLETKATYCYLDLFNTFGFLCILSLEYFGEDFVENYSVDLKSGNEIIKEVTIKINRNLLEDFINGHRPDRYYLEKLNERFNLLNQRIENLQDQFVKI